MPHVVGCGGSARLKIGPLYEVRRISDLREMLVGSAEIFGDRPAFLRKKDPTSIYEPVSYRQFRSDVNAFGTALLALGQQGQRIAVIGENQYAWVTTYLAVVNGVGIIVPIDHIGARLSHRPEAGLPTKKQRRLRLWQHRSCGRGAFIPGQGARADC